LEFGLELELELASECRLSSKNILPDTPSLERLFLDFRIEIGITVEDGQKIIKKKWMNAKR
jgi:hypothetical protein